MWDNQLELTFIELFQAQPILWDLRHRQYKDKSLNHDAWNRLAEVMGKTVSELKKKKESLFASYRKYRKMVRDSARSGVGENEIYKPVWFAYDALDSFLGDGLTPRTTINTTSNIQQPDNSAVDVDNGEHTINEKELVGETRNEPKTPSTARPRSLQCEVKEAGKHVKEAVSLLQQSIKKRESQASLDDCEIYALGLAKKLRGFSEDERLEIMYTIDGMILNRRRMKHPNRFTASTFVPPSQYSQCSSPLISSHSESLSGDALYDQNTRTTYTTPQIHVPQEEHIQQMHSDSEQSLEGGQMSDIIVQAYNSV